MADLPRTKAELRLYLERSMSKRKMKAIGREVAQALIVNPWHKPTAHPLNLPEIATGKPYSSFVSNLAGRMFPRGIDDDEIPRLIGLIKYYLDQEQLPRLRVSYDYRGKPVFEVTYPESRYIFITTPLESIKDQEAVMKIFMGLKCVYRRALFIGPSYPARNGLLLR